LTVLEIPAAITLTLPLAITSSIRVLRASYDPYAASLPVEITLIGSSGVGVIEPGQEIEKIIEQIRDVASQFKPFSMSFSRITSFPNTDIYYLEPGEREIFDDMHSALSKMQIRFRPNPFPYNPHCTIRARGELTSEASTKILNESFVRDEFIVDALEVFEYQYSPPVCRSLFEMKLS